MIIIINTCVVHLRIGLRVVHFILLTHYTYKERSHFLYNFDNVSFIHVRNYRENYHFYRLSMGISVTLFLFELKLYTDN